MDTSAAEWDDSAAASFDVALISSSGVPAQDRAALLSDELAQRLTAGRARVLDDAVTTPSIDWLNVDLGAGLVLADVAIGSLDVERVRRIASGGDSDCSLFIAFSDGIRFEQNGRREQLGPGSGLFVAHGLPVRSWYDAERMVVVRLPREAMGRALPVEAAGGLHLDPDDEAMEMLRCYASALLRRAAAGQAPSRLARRHIAELAAAAVTKRLGRDPIWSAASRSAARLERMLAFVAEHQDAPDLTMATVAASVGVSARTGYLIFEEAGIDFTRHLTARRLDRARELLEEGGPAGPPIFDVALAVGFSDLSHFNRRFRQRFGCTPRDVRRGLPASRSPDRPGPA